MDKRTTVVWTMLIIAMLGAVGASAYRYFIERDYMIFAIVECDPSIESCFISDSEYYPEFYKEIEKPARSIQSCNAWEGECEPLYCEPSEPECTETLCDAEEGDVCAGPQV